MRMMLEVAELGIFGLVSRENIIGISFSGFSGAR